MTDADRKRVLKMLSQARLTLIEARAIISAFEPAPNQIEACNELGRAYDLIGLAKRAFQTEKDKEQAT